MLAGSERRTDSLVGRNLVLVCLYQLGIGDLEDAARHPVLRRAGELDDWMMALAAGGNDLGIFDFNESADEPQQFIGLACQRAAKGCALHIFLLQRSV